MSRLLADALGRCADRDLHALARLAVAADVAPAVRDWWIALAAWETARREAVAAASPDLRPVPTCPAEAVHEAVEAAALVLGYFMGATADNRLYALLRTLAGDQTEHAR